MKYRRTTTWAETAKSKWEAEPNTRWMWDGLFVSLPMTSKGISVPAMACQNEVPVDEAGIDYTVGTLGPRLEITAADSTGQSLFSSHFASNCVPTKAITMMLVYEKTDSTNRESGGFGVDTSTDGDRCGTHFPWSNGQLFFDFAGKSNGTSRLIVNPMGYTTGKPEVWVLTAGPAGMAVYRDGILIGSHGTAVPTRTTGNSNGFGLGLHSGVDSDLAACYGMAGWDYQMNHAQVLRLSADPFGMWVKKRREGVLDFAGAPAGNDLAWKLTASRPSLAGAGGLAG